MKPTTIFTLGAVVLALSTTTALAADSGFYAGATIGYSNTSVDGELGSPTIGGVLAGDDDVKGADYGLLAGYRHEFGNRFFLGAEADVTFSSADASDTFGLAGVTVEKKHSFGLYAKPGYHFTDQLAAFATLGWKWNEYEVEAFGLSDDDTFDGFTFGGGIEYAIAPQVSLAGEYNRVALGSNSYDYGGGDYGELDGDEDIVKFAVKYHF